jgi:hypothetical protein
MFDKEKQTDIDKSEGFLLECESESHSSYNVSC